MGVNISNLKLLFIPPGTVFIGSNCSFCWIHVPPRAHLAELTLSLKTCWTVARIPHTYSFYISSNKCAHRVWPRFFPFAWKKNPPVCWKRYGWELWITKSTHASSHMSAEEMQHWRSDCTIWRLLASSIITHIFNILCFRKHTSPVNVCFTCSSMYLLSIHLPIISSKQLTVFTVLDCPNLPMIILCSRAVLFSQKSFLLHLIHFS